MKFNATRSANQKAAARAGRGSSRTRPIIIMPKFKNFGSINTDRRPCAYKIRTTSALQLPSDARVREVGVP